MEEPSHVSSPEEFSENAQGLGPADEAVVERCSTEYVGRWEKLVSTTNWEKGRIICEWRQELLAAGAPLEACSDEAWSRRARTVSPQHVGRLRRVFERFAGVSASYPGLFWSHFQAALDWNDAEMWLEGAVQNDWSVSQMRSSRWLAMGAPDELRPHDSDVIAAEMDEDSTEGRSRIAEVVDPAERSASGVDGGTGPDYSQGPDFGDEPAGTAEDGQPFDADGALYPGGSGEPPQRPFENLPELPPDLAEAFESFKLAILRHKVTGWSEVPLESVLASLEALRMFACAPS